MKLTISRQLGLMALLTLAILLIVGVIGNRVAQSIGAAVEYSEKNTVPAVEAIALMRRTFLEIRVSVLGHMTTWDEDEKTGYDQRIADFRKLFATTLDDYEKLAANSDDIDRQLLASDRKSLTAYLAAIDPVLEQSRNSQNTDAKELFAKAGPFADELEKSLAAHTDYSKKLAAAQRDAANAALAEGNVLSIASIVLGMLVIGGFSFALNRSIGRGLGQMEQAVEQVESELDLTTRVAVRRDDEIGKMGAALNRLLERLQGNLRSVAHAAAQVALSAETMSDASTQVAETSEAQSAAASDMAASMQELTVSINHVGDRATHTRETGGRRRPPRHRGRTRRGRCRWRYRYHRRVGFGVGRDHPSPGGAEREDRHRRQRHQGRGRPDQPAGLERRHRGGRAGEAGRGALPWWPTRCASWPSAPKSRRMRLPTPSV